MLNKPQYESPDNIVGTLIVGQKLMSISEKNDKYMLKKDGQHKYLMNFECRTVGSDHVP